MRRWGRKVTGSLLSLTLGLSMAFSTVVCASDTNPLSQGTLGYEVKKGDVNNDGQITSDDVLSALKVVTGSNGYVTLSKLAGDVNGDGKVSARDALLLLQNIAQLRDDELGIENLKEVNYYVPAVYEEGSSFLNSDAIGFYGADGYGKYTTGGRGGRVIYVTNLNDSGEGSFRAACEAEGKRIIVFRVSGNILLQSDINLKNGDVTIAGETAPGDGITLMNFPLTVRGDNVIIRYMNFRTGDYMQASGLYVYESGNDHGKDSLTIVGAKNVIIDHCAATWGTDETLSVTTASDTKEGTADNISVQWSIIADSLSQSRNVGIRLGLASLIKGNNGAKYTFHHNLYASHNSRMPEMGNYVDYKTDEGNFSFEFINNVVYNWGGGTAGKSPDTDANGQNVCISRYDYVNNYYLTGASSGRSILDECSYGNQLYIEGNMMDGELVENQTSLVTFEDDILNTSKNPYYATLGLYLDLDTLMYQGSEDFNYSYLKEGRFENTQMANVQPAQDAYEDVMAYVGSSLSRDSLDIGLIEGVMDKTAKIINYPYESAGWSGGKPAVTSGKEYAQWLLDNYPNMASYTPYTDTDGDGMSDAWEDFMGLDKNDAADGAASYLGTEYTNLDVFLQFLVENPAAAIEY